MNIHSYPDFGMLFQASSRKQVWRYGICLLYTGAVAGASDCNILEMGTVGRRLAVACCMDSCELVFNYSETLLDGHPG